MKRLFFAMFVLISLSAAAQTKVKIDSTGNFIALSQRPDTIAGEPTGKYLTVKDGTRYPVYLSATGRYYIVRTSKKTGKQYKQYLTVTP